MEIKASNPKSQKKNELLAEIRDLLKKQKKS
jgi:large-conductance mechanosensitive channel